jgi:hypothetical protein
MTESNRTPNMELGKVVVDVLVAEGVIISENQEDILSKICSGKMTTDEWISCAESKIIRDEGKASDVKSDKKN